MSAITAPSTARESVCQPKRTAHADPLAQDARVEASRREVADGAA